MNIHIVTLAVPLRLSGRVVVLPLLTFAFLAVLFGVSFGTPILSPLGRVVAKLCWLAPAPI